MLTRTCVHIMEGKKISIIFVARQTSKVYGIQLGPRILQSNRRTIELWSMERWRWRDGTMARWYDSAMAMTRWRCCDSSMTIKRCSIAPSVSRHYTIFIASSHNRAIDYFAHALFLRKWRQMQIFIKNINEVNIKMTQRWRWCDDFFEHALFEDNDDRIRL